MPLTASIQNEQTLRVNVTGPEDATTLRIVSGIAQCSLSAGASGTTFTQQQGTFAALVGPTLTPAQFRKATATVAISSLSLNGDGNFASWSVTGVDADYDDDSSRIELRFDLQLQVQAQGTNTSTAVAGVGFQVMILSTV